MNSPPLAGDRLWTPSDWAWAGGLLNVLLPGLYFGIPVVFGPFRRFDPEAAFALMAAARGAERLPPGNGAPADAGGRTAAPAVRPQFADDRLGRRKPRPGRL